MHLNGWIGLGKGPRETRFHLAGDRTKAVAVNRKGSIIRRLRAGPRESAFKNNICRICQAV